MSDDSAPATFTDKHHGHGAQFEIHLANTSNIPPFVLQAIKGELNSGATLYLDGARLEGNTLVLSLCRGSILLAKVDYHWNPGRKDQKFHVIMRQEIDEDGKPNLPRFDESTQEQALDFLKTLRPTSGTDPDFDYKKGVPRS